MAEVIGGWKGPRGFSSNHPGEWRFELIAERPMKDYDFDYLAGILDIARRRLIEQPASGYDPIKLGA